jgi:hypothetical protein
MTDRRSVMKSFLKLFFHAIPLGLGIVLSLISIAYTTEAVGSEGRTMSAILFGIIGFPMLVASAINFAKKFSEK